MPQKIGIATIYVNTNYGANLQAFATCKYVNSIGYDTYVLDYYSASGRLLPWLYKSWSNEKNKTFKRKIKLGAALMLSAGWKSKRIEAFKTFRKKYIKATPKYRTAHDCEEFGLDAVICGSDQVWNIGITEGINYVYFGDIQGVKKRISYAASMGKIAFQPKEEKEVKRLVSELDYCSVREEDAAQYLSALTEREVELVCDPVFLLDKSDYEEVSSKRLIKKDYVLLYSVVHNEDLTAIAKDYADKHGIELIEICSAKYKHATHKQIVTYGPSEFLSCFKYAKNVFTNSFHGTAFSLIFEKDFYIVDNKHGGSRITNLLGKVGLSNRLVSEKIDKDFDPIDYSESKKLLSEYVSFSKAFLDKALKSDKKELAGNSCVSCGACASVCKLDAIRLTRTTEGFQIAMIDQNKCVNCGMCQKVCPALNEAEKNQDATEVYAFKANDELRKNSTSGGAFAALAEAVIAQNGVFYGAAQTDDFSVAHIRGESSDDLAKMQGTKYIQSDMTACYAQIENDLKQGRKVLFSGTPCQVDGVKRFIKIKKLPDENFISVDIICHGVPSPAFYQAYMKWLEKEYGSKVVDYKFRSKKISWRGSSCYAKLANGQELKNDKKLCGFMNVYYSDNITRESCYNCPYTSKSRVGDLTISDYWGLENLDKSFEDALGVSMILVNTQKGRDLFGQVKGERIEGSVEIANQPQLSRPTGRPQTRDEFWTEYEKNGVKPLLKKYGGVKRDSLKTVLYKLKKKIFK
ncbi:MAG: 4Fe-4S dicluster domain-containing protein [Ruminococcaceae bacterium]|nr:4Fe-4S dicluster domain-containing protein [Oscillospiraceae bacterium]MBE6707195.1 4Fe-4S dicluster domain-containing protein [Oscillospiraceae bacterium]